MRENMTELIFILDRSGSMGGLESDTIGGFNAMIARQQQEDGEAHTLFVITTDGMENASRCKRPPVQVLIPGAAWFKWG